MSHTKPFKPKCFSGLPCTVPIRYPRRMPLAKSKEEITEEEVEEEIKRVILLLGIWLEVNHALFGITFT